VTDHPPAIPAIQVRREMMGVVNATGVSGYPFPPSRHVHHPAYTVFAPLGLSPEQPCRIGGHDE